MSRRRQRCQNCKADKPADAFKSYDSIYCMQCWSVMDAEIERRAKALSPEESDAEIDALFARIARNNEVQR